MSEQRKLATILAVDVAGYSRAAEADDAAAAAAVTALRHSIEEIIADHGGRIFNTAGDGFMIEFPAASSGVEAAMTLLHESLAGRRDLPRIRIGLHLGEVIVAPNGDLLGHGVNVAARLQALAEPGTAVVSQAVQSQVRRAADIPLKPQGRVQLDKMHERIEVFTLTPGRVGMFTRLGWRRLRPSIVAGICVLALAIVGYAGFRALTPSTPPSPALAVLPFDSGPGGDAALANGFASDLYDMLSGGDVMLVSKASSFALTESQHNIQTIRRELNADYVLDGAVTRSGDRYAIMAELIDAHSGLQVWRDSYEAEPAAFLAIRSQINVRVRAALFVLNSASAEGRTVEPAALRLFLYAWAPNPDGDDIYASHAGVVDSYRRALQIQPDFLQAWSDLSRVASIYRYHAPTQEERSELDRIGRQAAQRAVELEPNHMFGHLMQALYDDPVGRPESYRAHIDRAARTGEAQPVLLSMQAYELMRFGRAREAMSLAARARQLDINSFYILAFPDPLEFQETPAEFESLIRSQGLASPDPPAHWRAIHLGWLARRDYTRAAGALQGFEAIVAQIERNQPQMSAPYALKARQMLEQNRALHRALANGENRAALAADIARRAYPTQPGFRRDETAQDFYFFLLPALAMLNGADAAYLAWEARLSPLPRPDGRWVADQPLEFETHYFNDAMYTPYYAPLRRDPRFWRMIARMEFPSWWLDDPRWSPDFCRAGTLGYDCNRVAREAFAARR